MLWVKLDNLLFQRIRKQDFEVDFGPKKANMILRSETGDDPALFDRSLRDRLEQNRKVAEKNIQGVLDKVTNYP